MKKIILALLVCFVFSITANAQSSTFKTFKIDGSLGLDLVSDNQTSLIVTVEPHYRFADVFALGLRFQAAINFSLKQNASNLYTYSSNCISADYYVTDVKKPAMVFIGGGAGVFTQQDHNNVETDNFGFFPRVGVEFKRFRGFVEYNNTGGANNYFSVNAGFFLGGGRK